MSENNSNKKNKFIYNFGFEIEEEIEKTETKKEGDEEIKVTKKVKEKTPYNLIIKQPNRRQIEEAEMEYSVEMSRCIKAGIVTKAMLTKKYADSGGVFAEEESKKLGNYYSDAAKTQLEIEKVYLKKKLTKKDQTTLKELLEKTSQIKRNIIEIETAYSHLFDHTSDIKAQNKVIMWFMLYLCFYRKNEDDELIPLFEGDSFEDKREAYYSMDENGHFVFDLVKNKLISLISFWYFSENASQEDIKSFDEKMDSGEI